MLTYPCLDLSGVIVDTEQYEDKFNCIYLLEAGIFG